MIMDSRQKDNLKSEYIKLENVFCPYLMSEVVFNNKGFMHLLYKSGNRKRNLSDIKNRISFLGESRNILSITTTVQELEEKITEDKKINYFGFIAILNKVKLKIVVRKDNENGNYHFYSVIPHFITSPKRDGKKTNVIEKLELEIENEKTAP